MGMGNLAAFEQQWQDLMERGAWSEDFTFTLDVSYLIGDFTVSGIFSSGTHGEVSPAQPYAPRKAVRKEEFCIALKSLPALVTDPKRMLQGAVITSATRGTFKVMEVRGEKSGTLSLMLNPAEAPKESNTFFGISGQVVGVTRDGR